MLREWNRFTATLKRRWFSFIKVRYRVRYSFVIKIRSFFFTALKVIGNAGGVGIIIIEMLIKDVSGGFL